MIEETAAETLSAGNLLIEKAPTTEREEVLAKIRDSLVRNAEPSKLQKRLREWELQKIRQRRPNEMISACKNMTRIRYP